MNTATSRPPVLLADGAFYGTLAAARALGQAGIRVTVADPSPLATAGWSCHVARRLAAPSPSEGERFVEWLLDFGQREPGHVLLATSDDAALLYALHREELGRCFRLAAPPPHRILRLLDKWQLAEAARAAGLDVPRTTLPRTEAELLADAAALGFPVLLKPRTQALLAGHAKGRRVETPRELAERWRATLAHPPCGDPIAALVPGISLPMLQAYHPEGASRIYSLSGWIERGGPAVLRASSKLLQRPARLGTGVCFEHAEVDPDLAERVVALCRAVGYHGVFEAELLPAGGRHLLIDFNPRFFGQMGFDVARGLPLPLLAYHDALGGEAHRAVLLERAAPWRPRGTPVYRHRLTLELVLRGRRLTGRMAPAEVRRWREWLRTHRADATDAASAPGDRLPGVIDAVRELVNWVRHPRSSLRTLALDA